MDDVAALPDWCDRLLEDHQGNSQLTCHLPHKCNPQVLNNVRPQQLRKKTLTEILACIASAITCQPSNNVTIGCSPFSRKPINAVVSSLELNLWLAHNISVQQGQLARFAHDGTINECSSVNWKGSKFKPLLARFEKLLCQSKFENLCMPQQEWIEEAIATAYLSYILYIFHNLLTPFLQFDWITSWPIASVHKLALHKIKRVGGITIVCSSLWSQKSYPVASSILCFCQR